MQVRILFGINVLLAVGLTAFLWSILPFAQGVACDVAHGICAPLTTARRAFSAAGPALLLLALAWAGAKVSTRSPRWGMTALVAGPAILVCWGVLVWATSVS